jgi:hypothetical protein
MAQMFFTLVTEIGAAKLANATALGTKVNLTHIAVGDGNGNPITPLPTMEALVHEVHRAPINNLSLDPGNASLILVEMVIPPEVGGFTVHEVGVFDDQGNLFAVASFPATYKPTLAEGSGRELAAILRIQVSSTSSITLKIDPTMVLASRKYVDDKITVVRTLVEAHAARKDDPHETLPEGGEAGQVIIKQEDGSLAWGTVAGVPVGQLCFSTTASPLPGTVPVNVKQKFTRDVYPQLVAFVQASGGFLATEAEWDAEAAAQEGTCGRYCLTDTHIILPCYKHYFASAQDGVAGKGVGDWAGDAIRNIEGTWSGANWAQAETGAVYRDASIGGYTTSASVQSTTGTHFDAALVVPTADENRPKTSYLLPCIKAYDAAVNASQVDMLALATQVAQINGDKVDKGDDEYRSVVGLKGSRSTTGTWTVPNLLAGKPLYLIMNVSNTSTAYRVVTGAIGATGSSVQQFIFLSGSSQGTTNATIVIPTAVEVVLEISTIYSGGTIYAYQ